MSRPAQPARTRRTPLSQEAAGGGLAALASLQFGAVVVLGKVVSRTDLSTVSMLAIRFAIAAAVLAGVLRVIGHPLGAARREGLALAGLGVAGYAVEATLFFAAIRHGTASAVTLLFFTYPVLVALLLAALGRGIPGSLVGGALVTAVAGAAIVVASSGGLDISGVGVALALGSAAVFACYLVVAELTVKQTRPTTSALWISSSAAAVLFALSFLAGEASAPADGQTWGRVAAMGVATGGAFFCLFAALQRLGAVRTAIVSAMEPLAAAALAVVFLGEPVRAGTLLGGALILAGAVAASAARRVPRAEPPIP